MKTIFKCSPTPWKQHHFWKTTVYDENGRMVAIVRPEIPSTDEDYNIAKLIAAAPELLGSLVKILDNFKSCIAGGNGELETDKEDIAKAEAAIKKATE